ncbi:amino acid ABC transporter ATP-binding protein [Azospirillum sp. RWY-5-1]|uniref:Amino acid ABC transporter ATP-binding protein n=1 Tax=Azospirillum oleiclasticum TaxID=2735135 RepID=A0ABX2TLI8_9PROT|nr:amino acid ABC transporter ATP-binding protein [Azospirillum oleiclasticum]NYZ16509.1 amino acid ABC transporter ATP-binding protein [Azospirillum oleiclasticum]NYZ24022.1 amino acid ABC transporter ATP-binding protein [Azospirillum oleiclasticum]
MRHLDIVDLRADYGSHTVLERINLEVGKGEIVSLIGPSGSGKSTLLRVILGLLPPIAGEVRIGGQTIDYRNKRDVKAIRSRVAVVFQQYNLFQNMDVLRNVTIAPVKVKGRPRAEVEEEAKLLLTRVGLGDKLKSYPDQLSGGQQQRVAIARALALKPEILLLDEVTSALDPELVNEVLDTIRDLATEGMTMLIVSHEMAFVREVSSKVVFMAAGHVVETGPPKQIFDNPQMARTQDFVGKILRH